MSDLMLSVGGRDYPVTCRPGGEDRLRRIGAALDEKVRQATRALGDMGEARQLLFAALLMGDELLDLRENAAPAEDPEVPLLIVEFARRVEELAQALEGRAATS
jgi:cell division protein ZapA